MTDPLNLLVEDGILEEVISRLKSGKEADIYVVQHAGEIIAAKLYKERQERSFKNNAAYREGRTVRNSRTARAMARGSRFGQAAAEEDWKSREADALQKLFAAGVRVPQPVLFYEGVLLMELVIDPDGHPAPRLIDAHVDPARARELYFDLRQQAIKMLSADVIHGDLSPYNILVAWNGPTIIDFPQIVDAAHNRQAFFFFERDLEAVRRFFAALDPSLNAHASDAREIWRAWEKRDLTPDFVPPLRAQRGPPSAPAGRPPQPQPRQERQMQPQGRGDRRDGRQQPRGAGRGGGANPVVSFRGEPTGAQQGQPSQGGSQGRDARPRNPEQRGGGRGRGGQQRGQQQPGGGHGRGGQHPLRQEVASSHGPAAAAPPPPHAQAPNTAPAQADAAHPAKRKRRRRGGRGRGRGGTGQAGQL